MANRRLFQFLYSRQPKLTMITGSFTAGANGTVASGSVVGAGVYSVLGYGNGNYQVQLQDNYYALVANDFSVTSGINAAEVNVASLVGSSSYSIAVVGNSNWSTVGLDTDFTAVIGAPFVATAVAGSGTGTAKLIIPSNISSIEVAPVASTLLPSNANLQGKGSAIYFKTLAPSTAMVSSAAVTTMAATNPVGSSQITFKMWFRDSSANP